MSRETEESAQVVGWVKFWRKWRGRGHGSPPRVSWAEVFWSGLGGVFGLMAVGVCALAFTGLDRVLIIGSIGASAVLLFGAIRSPLAQPRNLIGGHALSALIGVTVHLLLVREAGDPGILSGIQPFIASVFAPALAVGLSIAVMHATRTLHPPGGATALAAVIGSQQIHAMGYWFVLFPGILAPLILLLIALIFNNLVPKRVYPEFWW
ncbi:HPP family protein [Halothiobacillus sp. 15-55-196]|uniref:HPP family protein n=1 Tax=Halothiobacillus sp. 15-55-196 TaxID=1970382 RepID=UPI0025C63F04|nr:HPP family protein [Halothiobacillus sp. 15-55-196]